jgi:2-iminobutanoate/2-iminopropanoate deaminase
MKRDIIITDQAPGAIGPYSQAVRAGGFLFISGQIPLDPETGDIADDIVSQTRQALTNVQAIVTAAGATMADVVKTTVFIKDMAQFPVINETYAPFFPKEPPARACVEVARLPKDVLVEIEAVVLCP